MRMSLKMDNKWYCIYIPQMLEEKNLTRKDYLETLKMLKGIIGEEALIALRDKYLLSKVIIALSSKDKKWRNK